MGMDTFCNPVTIHFQQDGMGLIRELLESMEPVPQHVLLLTRGGNFAQTKPYAVLMEQLQRQHVQEIAIAYSNPDLADLYEVIRETAAFSYELIIAVGGGTVLDVAKSLAALGRREYGSIGDLRAAITGQTYLPGIAADVCPWIALPTTSGTGSEVTPWATIWDRELRLKYSVESSRLFAAHAIVDPSLTLDLPLRPTVVTGLDALCHATEAYWSKRSNTISRLYALEAIALLTEYLPRIVDEPRSLEARSQLAKGSMLAGLAFSNTRTTACHSISYPLTLLYGIEHGIAASMTLGSVICLNESAIVEKEKLLTAFGVKRVEEVQQLMDRIYDKAGLPAKLSKYGVSPEGTEAVVEQAYTKGRMDNNPLPISRGTLADMLLRLIG